MEQAETPDCSGPKSPTTCGTGRVGLGAALAVLGAALPVLGAAHPTRLSPADPAQPKKVVGGGPPAPPPAVSPRPSLPLTIRSGGRTPHAPSPPGKPPLAGQGSGVWGALRGGGAAAPPRSVLTRDEAEGPEQEWSGGGGGTDRHGHGLGTGRGKGEAGQEMEPRGRGREWGRCPARGGRGQRQSWPGAPLAIAPPNTASPGSAPPGTGLRQPRVRPDGSGLCSGSGSAPARGLRRGPGRALLHGTTHPPPT